MPFILGLLAIGLALYMFFLNASPRQVRAALLAVAGLAVGLGSLFLAVTGRLPAAIGVLIALWPLITAYIRNRTITERRPEPPAPSLTRQEAYEVLGLQEGASAEDIRKAHLRLMKKVHPDQAGSDWLAKKINAAKDLLLSQS